MTTARELAAYGLPSEAEVDAIRRRLTDPERAGPPVGATRSVRRAHTARRPSRPLRHDRGDAAVLRRRDLAPGLLPAHARRPRGRAPEGPRLGRRLRAAGRNARSSRADRAGHRARQEPRRLPTRVRLRRGLGAAAIRWHDPPRDRPPLPRGADAIGGWRRRGPNLVLALRDRPPVQRRERPHGQDPAEHPARPHGRPGVPPERPLGPPHPQPLRRGASSRMIENHGAKRRPGLARLATVDAGVKTYDRVWVRHRENGTEQLK